MLFAVLLASEPARAKQYFVSIPPEGGAGAFFQKPNYHDTLDKPLNEMTYTDPNVPVGTTYGYQVAAVNWCDRDSAGSAVATVPPGTAP